MAVISVGGYSFNIQPETASWSYSMNVQKFDTYGGRVVQLLACDVKGLSVEGYIRPKMHGKRPDIEQQWQGMREFEYNVKQIMAYHESEQRPVRFNFPEVNWSGDVYVTGYSNVQYHPDIPAVKYTLSFEIDSGFAQIEQAVSDYGLQNIPDGVGWVRNVYNTPPVDSWAKVKAALEKVVDDAGTSQTAVEDFYRYLSEESDEENAVAAMASSVQKVGDTAKELLSDSAKLLESAESRKSFMEKWGLV